MSLNNLDYKEVENILYEMGQDYIDIRKECQIGCNNLLDTHELTIAERNCFSNCFRKHMYAYTNFNKLATESLDKVNNLQEPNRKFYLKL